MARVGTWVPVTVIAVAAAVGAHYIGRIGERRGPIGAVSLPAVVYVYGALLALGASAVAVLSLRRLRWEFAGVVTLTVTIFVLIGAYSAFDTIAGSRDCPGTQDCDTLIVPVLSPLLLIVACAAAAGGFGATGALLRRQAR